MPFFINEESLREADAMRFRGQSKGLIDQFVESLKAPTPTSTTTLSEPAPEPETPVAESGLLIDDAPDTPDAPNEPAASSGFSLPSLSDLTSAWGGATPGQQQQGTTQQPAQQQGASSWLPSLADLAGQWMTPEQRAAASSESSADQGSNAPSILQPLMSLNRPRSTTSSQLGEDGSSSVSVESIANAGTRASRYAREIAQVAAEEGVPADVLAAILDTENSGETSVSPAGARGIMQVVPGQGFDHPGEDASDPLTSIRQGARALKEKYRMADGDWDLAGRLYFGVGTDAGGTSDTQYQDIFRANRMKYQPQPGEQGPTPIGLAPREGGVDRQPMGIAEGEDWRTRWSDNLTPNQIDETLAIGMDWDSAIATCGIAGAIALARAKGSNPNFGETLRMYERLGEWNKDVGLVHGYQGQLRMLKRLGVDAHAEGIDEQKIARTVMSGAPVQINATGSGGHYYVATDYDPQTGRFNWGNSAGILKRANGRTWFRLDELAALGVGTPTNAIYLD